MTAPPLLTDRTRLARQRARALRHGGPETFLFEEVAVELEERLAEVNRSFTDPVLVGPFPDYWTRRLGIARAVPDDPVLALDAGAHDLVLSPLSLHWADDPLGQLVQMRRALRPDGLMLAATFGGQTLSELRSALATAESDLTGGLSPRVLPMAEIRDLGHLLQRAGFALPVADRVLRRVAFAGLAPLARDLRGMGETNALAARLRTPTRRALFDRAARLYRDRFADAEGRLLASFEIIFLAGWAPGPSQQQPLRPGSAKVRLADALGTVEHGPRGPRHGPSD